MSNTRLHRFFISDPLEGTKQYTLTNEGVIHQLLKVFRYKVGQEVILFDGSGFDYRATVESAHKAEIAFTIGEKSAGLVPQKDIAVCFSLIKKDNAEMIVQKCTELGVSAFYPVVSERSEKKGFNIERAQKIIVEAAEQSGWSKLPVIHNRGQAPFPSLEEILNETKDKQQIVFHTDASAGNQLQRSEGGIVLFIGPEGGFSDTEIELFKKYNVTFDSLGQSVLRAETAAVVGVAKLLL